MTINCPLTKVNFLEPVQMKIVRNILATFFLYQPIPPRAPAFDHFSKRSR